MLRSNDATFDDGDPFLESEEVDVEAGESEDDSEQFDATGRRVATLAEGLLAAATHEVPLNASRWSAGVHLVRLMDGAGAVTTSQLTVGR